ncbi:S8 family serine peptidase [Siphonobacter sp.]|uniref:S8 family serine peptidase n=1 Tax=Siphonobacter sp. TaxID=1869184 RepID=UPI003B3A15DC
MKEYILSIQPGQTQALEAAIQKLNGTVTQKLSEINVWVVSLDPRNADAVRQLAGVAGLEESRKIDLA